MILTPGTLVRERYRVVRLIGQGNMGAVYEAFDERLSQPVALKQTLTSGEQFARAFEREAQMLAELRHPVLPRVIDYFTDNDAKFMVMDYIVGEDLGTLLNQRGGPLMVDAVLKWADQILHALEYLHRQNPPIVHRDIKPQNLKLTAEGQIVLLDFGLAKGKPRLKSQDYQRPPFQETLSLLAQGQTSKQLDEDTDSIFGFTRQYAPLEQVQGIGADTRSDIYALGATLYHLLTGTPPPEAQKRIQALGYDTYSHYEAGLDALVSQMDPKHPRYAEAKTCERQFRDNIEQARLFGDIPASQNERADLIDTLNDIAADALNAWFIELCRLKIPATPPGTASPEPQMRDLLIPAHEINPRVPIAVSTVLQQALSLDPEQRHASASTMRARLQAARQSPDSQDSFQDVTRDHMTDEPFLPPFPEEPAGTAPPRRSIPWVVLVVVLILIAQSAFIIANYTVPSQTSRVRKPYSRNNPTASPIAHPAPTGFVSATIAMNTTNAGMVTELARWDETDVVLSVAFSPDSQMVAYGLRDGVVRVRLVHHGEVVNTFEGHTRSVWDVAFSPDGSIIASGSWDATVSLWDVDNGTLLSSLDEQSDQVHSIVFAPDGRAIAASVGSFDAGDADRLLVWHVQDGTFLRSFDTEGILVRGIAFSPDGSIIAGASEDGRVRLWLVQDGALIRTLEGHTAAVTTLAFSPDGQTLASASEDTTVRLWQVQDGRLLHTLRGHEGPVDGVVFSPVEQVLASAGDSTVRLWSISKGTLLHTFDAHGGQVYDVAFSPDGTLLASGSYDHTVRLWGVAE